MVSLIVWQKIIWLNFHKIQNSFAFRHVTDQTLKNQKRNIHLWCLHKRGVGRGVLKTCHVLMDFIILNIRSIVHFCGWWKWEGHLLVIFCGRHIWVTSKTIIIQKKNKFNYKTNRNLIISPLTQISRTTPLIWHLLFQSQQWKRQNNVWNMFKVNNNKDARPRSITSF